MDMPPDGKAIQTPSGSIMQSRHFMSAVEGIDGVIPFGASITVADMIHERRQEPRACRRDA